MTHADVGRQLWNQEDDVYDGRWEATAEDESISEDERQ